VAFTACVVFFEHLSQVAYAAAVIWWLCIALQVFATRGYKDGLQPETLVDGNWLVKQNQPVSKIETKSHTNLRSLYESWFRNALISKSVILWWQAKGLQGVTRMAYSPSLWLMAIGWWNKINQCRKLKLNLTQTWGVCMSLDSGMHWSQNQWCCDDKSRKE